MRRDGLKAWVGGAEESQAQVIEADDAVMALELLNLMPDCLLWQCGWWVDHHAERDPKPIPHRVAPRAHPLAVIGGTIPSAHSVHCTRFGMRGAR